MKFKLAETDYGFFLELNAETMEDAAKIVRLGMNHTKQTRLQSFVEPTGEFSTSIVFVKHKRATGFVVKMK